MPVRRRRRTQMRKPGEEIAPCRMCVPVEVRRIALYIDTLITGHLQHTDSVNGSRRAERIAIMHAHSYQTTHQLAQLYTVERESGRRRGGGVVVSMATFPPWKKKSFSRKDISLSSVS